MRAGPAGGAKLDDDEFAAWLRLLETPELGRAGARRLLAAFGSPVAVFEAGPAALGELVGAAVVRSLAKTPPEFAERLAAALNWRHGGPGRRIVTLGDAGYPPLLLQAADPPLLLYLLGDPALLGTPAIAVVGSRNPSAQGADNARAFAAALAAEGYTIVSGLALGIDGAAHEGALAAGGKTLAVVGTGLDIVYPGRHRDLARRIEASGLMLSEYPPGTPPRGMNFPQRNRLIAGLASATLVVEAALRSGSLITARLAVEAGREVFAVPGSIHAPQSRGCHALIRQGALLVESAAEIVAELRQQRPAAAPVAPVADPEPVDAVLDALGNDPTSLDALLARTGWSTPALAARLLELELEGRLARLPGGLYQRRGIA
ncbi:MAG: DNA-processing protein DprA [Burkholderiales bacterium]|nr:DNA-processing protein DprA [Burkholderiales bacterium]